MHLQRPLLALSGHGSRLGESPLPGVDPDIPVGEIWFIDARPIACAMRLPGKIFLGLFNQVVVCGRIPRQVISCSFGYRWAPLLAS